MGKTYKCTGCSTASKTENPPLTSRPISVFYKTYSSDVLTLFTFLFYNVYLLLANKWHHEITHMEKNIIRSKGGKYFGVNALQNIFKGKNIRQRESYYPIITCRRCGSYCSIFVLRKITRRASIRRVYMFSA